MSEPTLEAVWHIPLSIAVLCEDCREVSNGVNVCPACGSKSVANIAPWLETEANDEENTERSTAESETALRVV